MKRKSSKPVIGGILILIAGLLALGMGALFLAFDSTDLEAWGYDPSTSGMSLSEVDDALGVCGIVGLVLALVTILGGVFAIMRRGFALAILGGVCGIIGIGFGIGAIMSFIGLIIVAIAREEF